MATETDTSSLKNTNMKKTAAEVAVLCLLTAAAGALIAYIAGYVDFAVATAVTAPIGLIGLGLLAKDVYDVFKDGYVGKIVLKFIFRLACFAVLLYVLLVRIKLNPLGAALGITLPLFCMMAVVLHHARKEGRESIEE